MTAASPTGRWGSQDAAATAATTPDRVRRLRELAAAAARGESLLLCVESRDPAPRAARATSDLATLAAFALAYATGKPVPTVVAVSDAGRAAEPAAMMGWLTGHRAADRGGPIERAATWLGRLSAAGCAGSAGSAFLAQLTQAWAFAATYGGEPAAVARSLWANQFVAWPATAAHTRQVCWTAADGARYGLLSPATYADTRAPRPDPALLGPLANTVVLRVHRGVRTAELTRLCGQLDPDGPAGKLVLLVPPLPARRLAAHVAAVSRRHDPVWVLDGAADWRNAARLGGMRDVLADHGACLGGVALTGAGRLLEQTAALATALIPLFTTPILDRTA